MKTLRMTEAEFQAMQRRVRDKGAQVHMRSSSPASTATPCKRSDASPYRSKTEAAFSGYLQAKEWSGEIARFWYEPLSLRLPGKKNFYKPDFLVLAGDGLTFYEVKGWSKSNERALVKIKTAAGLNPWARFVWVTRNRKMGWWDERVIEP